MKKLIGAALALALSGCSHSDTPRVNPPPAITKLERISLRLDKRLEGDRAAIQHNFDRTIPIINALPVSWGTSITVLVHYGLVSGGPKTGQCTFSWRYPQGGAIELYLWGDDPNGQCHSSGTVSREHWSGGFGWEIAHLYDCYKAGACADGAYATPEAAKLDRDLFNLPWDGELIRE